MRWVPPTCKLLCIQNEGKHWSFSLQNLFVCVCVSNVLTFVTKFLHTLNTITHEQHAYLLGRYLYISHYDTSYENAHANAYIK